MPLEEAKQVVEERAGEDQGRQLPGEPRKLIPNIANVTQQEECQRDNETEGQSGQ
jgi:hypothetical protein